MKRTVTGSEVAANAFIATHQNIMSTKDVKRYVGMVQKRVNHKTDFYVGSYDETVFMKTFDFIFAYDREHKNIIVPTEVYSDEVLKGYFRKNLEKEFINILDNTGKEFLGVEKQKQLVKKR